MALSLLADESLMARTVGGEFEIAEEEVRSQQFERTFVGVRAQLGGSVLTVGRQRSHESQRDLFSPCRNTFLMKNTGSRARRQNRSSHREVVVY